MPSWHSKTWLKNWAMCPDGVERQEDVLLTRMANEGVTIVKAFDKTFEYDHDNCWIKEKVWKRGMSVAEIIHQVKTTLTGKRIKRRLKEQNTPKYDIDQEVYEQKHLVVLDEEVLESLCEILKGLAEKGFRVDPSLVSYGDSTAKDDKE
ncbi:uncharacterized protein EAF01_002849 [Botrytis porri]|uniref:Uncharacterized protein n=1 Tax=Botrytis porri TaxID=87229 RepID=A0A4Z1KB39_9HELO|nr:uncharacterized protein EAF01_002849 [Botrytis porri]KAF7911342.1 hypothetical protein EAF01_002849 [Botrytis porri]TGO83371.1 hypothetical protein BPOR_0657g00020 [Botrytis porri]